MYLAAGLAVLAVGAALQLYARFVHARCERIQDRALPSGSVAARRMLDANGLRDIALHRVEQRLADHYSAASSCVFLSDKVYAGHNITSLAVACHECGHALQHAQGSRALKRELALSPVTELCSWLWLVVLLVGYISQADALCVAGLAICAIAFVLSAASLPAELNASSRALSFLKGAGPNMQPLLDEQQAAAAQSVLRASAAAYLSTASLGIGILLRKIAAYLTAG